MNRLFRAVGVLSVLLGFCATAYGQSETFDFSGVLVQSSDLVVGDSVTGTFTINYSAADLAQSTSFPGSTNFTYENSGGTEIGFHTPDPGALTFSMMANVDGFSYVSTPATVGTYFYQNYVTGHSGGYFSGSEMELLSASAAQTESYIEIYANPAPYNSTGFPDVYTFVPSSNAIGYFATGGAANYFDLTSISPATSVISAVPEPSTYAMMAFGLFAVFGVSALRRRNNGSFGARSF